MFIPLIAINTGEVLRALGNEQEPGASNRPDHRTVRKATVEAYAAWGGPISKCQEMYMEGTWVDFEAIKASQLRFGVSIEAIDADTGKCSWTKPIFGNHTMSVLHKKDKHFDLLIAQALCTEKVQKRLGPTWETRDNSVRGYFLFKYTQKTRTHEHATTASDSDTDTGCRKTATATTTHWPPSYGRSMHISHRRIM